MAKKKPPPTPPPPAGVPADTLAALHAACRAADSIALLAWADALEEAGDPTAATLRQLPHARDEMADRVRAWCEDDPGEGQVNFYAPKGEAPWWFCGDWEIEGDDATDIVGPLIARWDQFHPAIEWLLRELRLTHVRIHSKLRGKGKQFATPFHHLTFTKHLAPLPEGHTFCWIFCSQSR